MDQRLVRAEQGRQRIASVVHPVRHVIGAASRHRLAGRRPSAAHRIRSHRPCPHRATAQAAKSRFEPLRALPDIVEIEHAVHRVLQVARVIVAVQPVHRARQPAGSSVEMCADPVNHRLVVAAQVTRQRRRSAHTCVARREAASAPIRSRVSPSPHADAQAHASHRSRRLRFVRQAGAAVDMLDRCSQLPSTVARRTVRPRSAAASAAQAASAPQRAAEMAEHRRLAMHLLDRLAGPRHAQHRAPASHSTRYVLLVWPDASACRCAGPMFQYR